MSRIRMILPVFAAVLAMSAVASAAAAETSKYLIEGKEILGSEKYAITATMGTARLNSVIGGAKMFIECTNDKLVGENFIEAEGKSVGETDLENCTLLEVGKAGQLESKSLKCGVKTPINIKFDDQLVIGPSGLPEDELQPRPNSGGVFVEVQILSQPGQTCLIAAKLQATGSYVGAAGAEGEVERREHETTFTSTGSKLALGKLKASFTNKLTGVKLKKLEGETVSKKFRILTEE